MLSSTKSRLAGKHLSLLFIAFLFLQLTTLAQEGWFEQTSGTNMDLWSVCFADDNIGLAVGDSGVILKTTNGGDIWVTKNSGTANNIASVQFSDNNTAWAVSGSSSLPGKLFRTTNQGEDWSIVYSDSQNTLKGLFFLNSDTGWVGGENSLLLRTTNGGVDWEIQDVNTTYGLWLRDIFFVDKYNGWIVAPRSALTWDDYLLKTTDGGENWIELGNPDCISIFFIEENTGWQTASGWPGQGYLMKTTDGGYNWLGIFSPITTHFYDVYFKDTNTGWVVGGQIAGTNIRGEIHMSTNGGNDWLQQYYSDDKGGLTSLYFVDDYIGWAVGTKGIILKTTTGGVVSVEEKECNEIPTVYKLTNNYPNPFNPSTKIKYSVPQSSNVVIKVFDILGNEIETLTNEYKPTGTYEITWYAENLPSGIYFYRLQAGDFIETKKMILLK